MKLSCSNIKKFLIFQKTETPKKFFIFHELCCCTASATDLRELFLGSGVFYLTLLPRICHSTASATDLRELFSLSGVLYFTLRLDIWHQLLLSKLPWKSVVLL